MYTYATQLTQLINMYMYEGSCKHLQHLYLHGSITMLELGRDCGVCFLNTLEAKIVIYRSEQKINSNHGLNVLRGLVGCAKNLVIVAWSIGIQLN